MKTKLLIFSAALILCSCGANPTQSPESEPPAVVINDPYSGQSGASGSVIRLDKLPEFTEIPITVTCYDSSEVILKILAGDSDTDIYFLNASDARKLIEKEIFEPIDSKAVAEHNASCFDYLNDFCTVSGEPVLMPITSSVTAFLVPAGVYSDMPDVSSLDGFLEWVRSSDGSKKAYTRSDDLYTFLNYQYENYFCDFKNRSFDYNTETYRHIYSELLSGFERYSLSGSVKGFENASGKDLTDENAVLAAEGNFSDYSEHAENWRAVPIPKISENVGGSFINVIFAYVNPYGLHKDSAIKILETVAQNYPAMTDGGVYNIFNYPFIKKDRSDYGEKYHPDSPLFGDFFCIAQNGFVHGYQLLSQRRDIDLYQSGEISLDEAIEMYGREIGAWLNE